MGTEHVHTVISIPPLVVLILLLLPNEALVGVIVLGAAVNTVLLASVFLYTNTLLIEVTPLAGAAIKAASSAAVKYSLTLTAVAGGF